MSPRLGVAGGSWSLTRGLVGMVSGMWRDRGSLVLAGLVVAGLVGVGVGSVGRWWWELGMPVSGGVDTAVGRSVAEGDVRFEVRGVDCSFFSSGVSGVRSCLVWLDVANSGGVPLRLVPSAQQGFDERGGVHSADEVACRAVDGDGWRTPVPAGGVGHGVLVFGVGEGGALTRVVLHGTVGSIGVRVRVS